MFVSPVAIAHAAADVALSPGVRRTPTAAGLVLLDYLDNADVDRLVGHPRCLLLWGVALGVHAPDLEPTRASLHDDGVLSIEVNDPDLGPLLYALYPSRAEAEAALAASTTSVCVVVDSD